MTRAILFDYGGTLDTNGVHWSRVIWQGYEAAGVKVAYDDFKEAYVYGERALAVPGVVSSSDTFIVVLQKKISAQFQYLGLEDALTMKNKVVEYCDEVARKTTAAAKAILQQFSYRYKLILVSNFYGNLKSVLKDYELLNLFDDVVESSVVGVRKPNSEIFALALKRNQVSASECVVVGDSLKNDILPAQSLQISTIWLNREGWENCNDYKDVGSEIHSLDEIPKIL